MTENTGRALNARFVLDNFPHPKCKALVGVISSITGLDAQEVLDQIASLTDKQTTS